MHYFQIRPKALSNNHDRYVIYINMSQRRALSNSTLHVENETAKNVLCDVINRISSAETGLPQSGGVDLIMTSSIQL